MHRPALFSRRNPLTNFAIITGVPYAQITSGNQISTAFRWVLSPPREGVPVGFAVRRNLSRWHGRFHPLSLDFKKIPPVPPAKSNQIKPNQTSKTHQALQISKIPLSTPSAGRVFFQF
ncbi:MAG TPA: hypothetical protein VG796_12620 [Verrucomicrobiales bacterium]|nr:hypothetical protein [Verrucomicrobiales bacterium]